MPVLARARIPTQKHNKEFGHAVWASVVACVCVRSVWVVLGVFCDAIQIAQKLYIRASFPYIFWVGWVVRSILVCILPRELCTFR